MGLAENFNTALSIIDARKRRERRDAEPQRAFPIHAEWRPGGRMPTTIPWEVIAPHEAQAVANHAGQSLKRLAQRGGLTRSEAVAVLEDRQWEPMDFDVADARLRELCDQSATKPAQVTNPIQAMTVLSIQAQGDGKKRTGLKVPTALYSCHHCYEEQTHRPEDLAWSDKSQGWVCEECDRSGELGTDGPTLAEYLAEQEQSELSTLRADLAQLRREAAFHKQNAEGAKLMMDDARRQQYDAMAARDTAISRAESAEAACAQLRVQIAALLTDIRTYNPGYMLQEPGIITADLAELRALRSKEGAK